MRLHPKVQGHRETTEPPRHVERLQVGTLTGRYQIFRVLRRGGGRGRRQLIRWSFESDLNR